MADIEVEEEEELEVKETGLRVLLSPSNSITPSSSSLSDVVPSPLSISLLTLILDLPVEEIVDTTGRFVFFCANTDPLLTSTDFFFRSFLRTFLVSPNIVPALTLKPDGIADDKV